MRRELDSIVFENKKEIEDVMKVIEQYVSLIPKERNNETLKELYSKLDIMDMEW